MKPINKGERDGLCEEHFGWPLFFVSKEVTLSFRLRTKFIGYQETVQKEDGALSSTLRAIQEWNLKPNDFSCFWGFDAIGLERVIIRILTGKIK